MFESLAKSIMDLSEHQGIVHIYILGDFNARTGLHFVKFNNDVLHGGVILDNNTPSNPTFRYCLQTKIF